MAIALPVTKLVMPSCLNGQKNGRLGANLLKNTGVPGVQMVPPAARALDAMVVVMMRDLGQNLKMRTVGGYRDLYGQYNIFCGPRKRYRPATAAEYATTAGAHRKLWPDADRRAVAAFLNVSIAESVYWVKIRSATGGYPATAAVPGTSNHGWALALDFAEELDADSTPESIRTSTVMWLVYHAHLFGFSAETQSEVWHWRYVAGDNIPSAVLDVERYLAGVAGGTIPAPPPANVPVIPTTPSTNWMENAVRQLTTLRPGARDTDADSDVKRMQSLLIAAGYAPGPVDGIYGAGGSTEKALRAFQTDKNVVGGADGVCGQNSWVALLGA